MSATLADIRARLAAKVDSPPEPELTAEPGPSGPVLVQVMRDAEPVTVAEVRRIDIAGAAHADTFDAAAERIAAETGGRRIGPREVEIPRPEPEPWPTLPDGTPAHPDTVAAIAADIAASSSTSAEALEHSALLAGALAQSAGLAVLERQERARALAAPVYGDKVAAYLGRLAEPTKRGYAVACATAMLAGCAVPPFVEVEPDDDDDDEPATGYDTASGEYRGQWVTADEPGDVVAKLERLWS